MRLDLTSGRTGAEMIPENLRDNPLAMAFDPVATAAKFDFAELTVEVDPANIVAALRLAKDSAALRAPEHGDRSGSVSGRAAVRSRLSPAVDREEAAAAA